MPYTSDNPPDWLENLPPGAVKIGVAAFNAVLDETGDEDKARQAAWATIKREYEQVDESRWVRKAGLQRIELVITKATLQPDGSMRWQLTASDTERDSANDQATIQLFNDWIERVEKGIETPFLPPPRKPFLGISHYPDLDGFGEAGVAERLFIDGQQFKADGPFLDTPIGRALFEAIREERATIKRGDVVESPIRISAAWWDIQHVHGDFVFTRKSKGDRCPLCAQGAPRVFLKGQLDHFASTRVPINERTSVELEEKSMAITKRDDAASIVGDALADELEEKSRELVGKSAVEGDEGLVIKAVTKTVEGGEYPAGDFLVVEDADKPSTWHLQVKKNGKADHGLMGAAWAALHEGYRGNVYEGPDKQKAVDKLQKLYTSEDMELPTEKAMLERMTAEGAAQEYSWMPLDGATTLGDANAWLEKEQAIDRFYTNWDLFDIVICNILQRDDIDQIAAIKQAVADFNEQVSTLKSNAVDAFLFRAAAQGDKVMADKDKNKAGGTEPTSTPVVSDPAAQLKAAVDTAVADASLGRTGKMQAVQVALNDYAVAVKAEIDAVAPPSVADEVADALKEALAPVSELSEQVALLLAHQQKATSATPQMVAPQQKSLSGVPTVPGQGDQGALPVSPVTGQPSKLTQMIRRSVGL